MNMMQQHGLPSNAMFPAFGMSETASATIQSKWFTREDETGGVQILNKTTLNSTLETVSDDHPDKMVVTEVGEPLPTSWIRIVDINNELLPEDRIGRLQIKGPMVMKGYYNNPEANKEVFVGDGWLNTGDLAFIHQGRLTLTGREKDVIVINGANYLNHEIETVVV
jgi:acyl-CoA synthetase (AMP-forming)/AMP-acid ligase II